MSGSRQQKRRRFVLLRDGNRCHVCKQVRLDSQLVADHVIPVGEGGEDSVDNMAPCCIEPCHREKTRQEARRGREGRQLAVAVFALVGLPAAGKTTIRKRLASDFDVPSITIDAEDDWTAFLKRIERMSGPVIAESNIMPLRYRVLLSSVPSRTIEVVAPIDERKRRLGARGLSDLKGYLSPHALAPRNVEEVSCDDYSQIRSRFEGLLEDVR